MDTVTFAEEIAVMQKQGDFGLDDCDLKKITTSILNNADDVLRGRLYELVREEKRMCRFESRLFRCMEKLDSFRCDYENLLRELEAYVEIQKLRAKS